MLTLTATGAGFHTLSPLGTAMAPAAFLRSTTNLEGTILHTPTTSGWSTEESLRHPYHAIHIRATHTEAGTFTTDVQITEITWTRTDDTGTHVIGTLDLGGLNGGAGLTVRAENQQSHAGTTWELDLADALEDQIQLQGFRFMGGSGDDVLIPGIPILPIYGRVEMHGYGGNDSLTGTLADDVLYGGTGNDRLYDISGTNILRGGAGNDTLSLGVWSDESFAWGGTGNDVLTSSNGSDRLIGGHGHDWIEGGRGNDLLVGNTGNDRLQGGEGSDRLVGGRGNDRLSGGDDADIFVFSASFQGWNRITDFDVTEDLLRFHGLEDAIDDLSFYAREGGTFVHWGEKGAGLYLENVAQKDLTEDLFLF